MKNNFKIMLEILDLINEGDKEIVATKLQKKIPEKAFLKNLAKTDRFAATLKKFMNIN